MCPLDFLEYRETSSDYIPFVIQIHCIGDECRKPSDVKVQIKFSLQERVTVVTKLCLKSSETTKNTKTQRSTSQPGRSFLFIFLNKSLDLTSFNVHRSPYLVFFSYKVYLIFSTVYCIATPARPTQRSRVTYNSANSRLYIFFSRYVSLGYLW